MLNARKCPELQLKRGCSSLVISNQRWNSKCVGMKAVREAFKPKLDTCGLQILLGCHSKLVVPSLTSLQTLNGFVIKKIFHQKSIYIRPDTTLLTFPEASPSNSEGEIIEEQKSERDFESLEKNRSDAIDAIKIHSTGKVQEQSTMSPNQGAIFTPLAQNFNETSGEIYSDYVNLLENEEYLSEDSDIQEAISRSLMEETFKIQQDTSLSVEQILMPLTTAINEHEVTRFNIMRRNVWDGTVRAMSRPNFTPKKRIDVKFTDDIGISEGAVDLGGPKREYFRLCLKYLKDYSGMFEGASGSKLLSCNSAALKENCYFFAGQLIAMSVVHGGQSPCFFSPILYKSLAKGPENTEAEVEDILDIDIRNQLIEIKTATSDTQLQVAISRASCILSLSGCFKKITLENKGAVTKDVAHWYVLQRTRTPFERFQEGLQSLGVLSALQQFPQQLQSLFIKLEKKLTAIEVEQLFKFRMSEEGSNRYEAELLVVGFWRDYLQDAEFCVDAVTLEEILIFATGSDSVPPLGFFPEPSLEFLHCKSKFPLANTCDCILRIPLTNNYTNFKNNMNFGIRNSPGFGKA